MSNPNETNDDVETAKAAFLERAAEKASAVEDRHAALDELSELDEELGLSDYGPDDEADDEVETDETEDEVEPRAASKPTAQKASKSVDETEDVGDETPDAFDEIEWEYLDPDVADAIRSIKKGYDDVVKTLQAELEGMKQVVAEQFNIAAEQRFNGYVASQDKRYAKLLEDGDSRAQVREEMDILRDGYRSRGKEVPAEDELFSKAFHSVFSTEIKKIDAEATRRSVRARQSQMTIPPSARRASPDRPLSDEEVARENLIAQFEKKAAGSN